MPENLRSLKVEVVLKFCSPVFDLMKGILMVQCGIFEEV